MKNFLIALLLGITVGGTTAWYFARGRENKHGRHAQDKLGEKLAAWHLTGDDIKNDLARGGNVVRRQASEIGATIADSTADARITAAIKAKLIKDPDLSALSISVNTTEGRVTLSGTAHSNAQIGKAMGIALDTEGVREVVSTVQVKAAK